jgi:RecB family exonuclease
MEAMTSGEPLQLGLEGMPVRLFACTPSRLTTWQDCPRRYLLTYLERPSEVRGQAWAHTTLGAAVHVALARWWSEPRGRRTPVAARALLERAWPRHGGPSDGFADDAQSARWRARAGDMVERYAATLDPDDEPVAVERTVTARTDRLALSGRVDRVDRRGDDLVVVDYKTGRSPSADDDAAGSTTLALYAVAVARTLRRRCTRVELHHLPSGRVAAHDHTPASLAEHVARAEEIAEQATAAAEGLAADGDRDALFPPRTSPGCGWCDFLRVCPSGRAAVGAARRPWDGLAAELGAPDEAA